MRVELIFETLGKQLSVEMDTAPRVADKVRLSVGRRSSMTHVVHEVMWILSEAEEHYVEVRLTTVTV